MRISTDSILIALKRGVEIVALSSISHFVYAFERTFTIVNESDQNITTVKASEDYLDEWGDNRIVGGAYILPRDEFSVRFDIDLDHCMFDVQIVAANKFEKEFPSMDLCNPDRPARVVFTGGRVFTVENKSDQAILSVQASMNSLNEWGGDKLGEDVIMPGNNFLMQVDGYRDDCLFDVRLVMEDDLEHTYEGVDLCESDRIIYPPVPKITVEVVPRRVGEQFRDCRDWNCPWMVAVNSGSYKRGSTEGNDDEIPVTNVTIPHSFAVGLYEISVGQFRYFIQSTDYAANGSCYAMQRGRWAWQDELSWENPGFDQGDSYPVVCVSWEDANAYVQWLRQETRRPYRLLAEAEWEYLGRGTDTTMFKSSGRANCKGCGSRWDGRGTAPVGMFPADRWGLHELYGNAWEWVQDCYTPGYSSAPRDGTAWELAGCSERVRRGGSWNTRPERLRAALRNKAEANFRSSRVGFRVAQTLNPSSIPDSERQVTSGFSRARQTESSGGSVTPDTEYRLTFRASPVYPQMAEREDIEGYAVVQFTVTASGTVRNPIVVDALPPGVFDAAAIKAARKFRYSPRIVAGKAVDVSGVRTRFRFRLSD